MKLELFLLSALSSAFSKSNCCKRLTRQSYLAQSRCNISKSLYLLCQRRSCSFLRSYFRKEQLEGFQIRYGPLQIVAAALF